MKGTNGLLEKTIIVSIDSESIEVPFTMFDDDDPTEDEIYEAAVNYIMSSIDIEVI